MLSVNNIYKSFNRLNILNYVSFSQKKGETIGLMGKNGSGKSTLLRIISRIMKADSGSIVFNDHDLLSSNNAHRKNMFYIGHDPGMYSFFSPFENFTFSCKLKMKTKITYWFAGDKASLQRNASIHCKTIGSTAYDCGQFFYERQKETSRQVA